MNKKQIRGYIDLFKVSGGLKRIRRTGWVLKGIKEVESVADHVFRVSFMAMVLGKDRKLNISRLLQMSLLHDLGETATSDIRFEQGTEVIASKEAKDHIELDILQRILPATGDKDHYLSLWYDYRDQISPEAKFLKQVKKLEMALQALEYQEFGNKKNMLDEFIDNARIYITDPDLKKMFKEIEERRKS